MSINVLADIVSNKRREISERKKARPLDSFLASVGVSNRSLAKALNNDRSDFILECKKASPSKGLIREEFDLEEILAQYSEFASAISVLTDEKYFRGSFSYLQRASESVELPILCKDFFIDSYQVYEARFHGADAILLMLSVLTDSEYKTLERTARLLNLDILTEVHSESELQRALKLEARIIGINNRDLKTLKIDLAKTEELVEKIPDDRIVISESGIQTRQDIKRLSPLVNGFLIGSSIMAKKDIRHQCKSLLYGNIKICGLTQPKDAIHVDQNGGIYGGLIFFQKSSRYIPLNTAKEIVSSAPLRYVGVFVNESPETIVNYALSLNLFAVQLHGSESHEDIKIIKSQLPDTQIWKAIHVDGSFDIPRYPEIDRYLLDTFSETEYGGTGKQFDWRLIDNLPRTELILAGGIDLNNIVEASSKSTYAIDLSSGVEVSPGIKSSEKLKKLFALLRV